MGREQTHVTEEKGIYQKEEHQRVDVVQGSKWKRRVNINRLFLKCNIEI